jgi:threonine/homoserine/homoserine lactone efflux protein
MFSVFISGLLTGFILQLAIGPVFFYLLNISIQRTLIDGLFAVLAVSIVDYLYIVLAILGVGKLLEKKKVKRVFGIFSSIVLALFGILMIKDGLINKASTIEVIGGSSFVNSFLSTFILTVSSPLTIVFWTSMFSTKAIEKNYNKQQLTVFGLSSGLATILFLGLSVIVFTLIKTSIPMNITKYANITVGSILIMYGIIRIIKQVVSLIIEKRSGSGRPVPSPEEAGHCS